MRSFTQRIYISGDTMGFFDKARGQLVTRFQEGASLKKQAIWRALPEWRKNQLRRVLKDSDHDGVPDRFDCQPFNKKAQEPKMQIDLSDEEDRILELHKIANRNRTKQESIKQMVQAFDADLEPKNPSAWGNRKRIGVNE